MGVMTRKREPVAVVLTDGGVLVKHTHDIKLATRLADEALAAEYGRPCTVVGGRAIWCRITHCLPNSWGAGEGWRWAYHYATGPGRGVFPAVEYLR
jgi:hypothetical protein